MERIYHIGEIVMTTILFALSILECVRFAIECNAVSIIFLAMACLFGVWAWGTSKELLNTNTK